MEIYQCGGQKCTIIHKKYKNGKIVCIHNNLENLFTELSKQWDYELNNDIPKNYLPGSGVSVWWKCKNINCKCKVWKTTINSRTVNDKDCPCCRGRFCIHNNLTTTHNKLLDEWDYSKNDELPSQYTYGSHVSVFWKCLKNPCGCHNYEMIIKDKICKNYGCPFCSKTKQRPCEHNNAGVYNPILLKEWDYNKNVELPSFYLPFSTLEVFLICTKNESHRWKASICGRNNGYSGCPDCKIIEKANYNLLTEYPILCEEWDYDVNDLTPEMYAPHSNKKVWWSCKSNLLHKWKTRISDRTKNIPNGCPFCNSLRCSEEHNLLFCNSKLSSEWHYIKNATLPSDHTPCSALKVWWQCKKNPEHSWESTIHDRSNGNGCPLCKNHGYSKIQIEWLNYVIQKENIKIIHAENEGEYYIQEVGKVDGYCQETNTVYEFHGDFYHGNPLKFNREDINPKTYKTYGELYDKTLKRDKLIISKGYNLIIIWEYEFLKLKKQIINDKKLERIKFFKIELPPVVTESPSIKPTNRLRLKIVEPQQVETPPIKSEIKTVKKLKLRIVDDTK